MKNFDLNTIIKKYNLDGEMLSKELFPDNKFPKVALNRITSGVSYLDTKQLDILSNILGIPVSELFFSDEWHKVIQGDIIKFHRNNYRVELHLETLVSEIYHGERLVSTETIIVDKNIKLSEYLETINQVIINLI